MNQAQFHGRQRHQTPKPLTRITAVLCALALGLGLAPWVAEAGETQLRRPGGRLENDCGGDRIDGICGITLDERQCSGDPADATYDADCFSCSAMESPTPEEVCRPKDEPCEMNEVINSMGALFESQEFDADAMLRVILAYWDSAYWNLPDRWGAHALDGYMVYAIVRNALKYHRELESLPTTKMALECMLRDHANRGLPTEAGNPERWFHGGERNWNSWSEDYMGFALGYAAADAWFASPWSDGEYYDEYYGKVDDAIELAFSISHGQPHTLRSESDVDPLYNDGTEHVMMRNHGEYSPVYAMVLIKHVGDINDLYHAATLPTKFTCSSKPATYDDLYRWVARKIEPNPHGPGYVFRSDACQRRDGVVSYCDDRPDDPPGDYGDQREPGHYPLERILPDLCITEHLEAFDPECDWVGPAGTVQAEHNYFFNCVFPDDRLTVPPGRVVSRAHDSTVL